MIPIPVIIVHWNRPDELKATVDALTQQTVPLKLTIVDNASSPEKKALARLAVPDVEWLELPANIGFGPGMNAGLKRLLDDSSAGGWIFMAAHDALPKNDCIERMLKAAESRPKAGLMAAEYGEHFVPAYHWQCGPITDPAPRGEGWQSVSYPNGTLMAARRDCLNQIGLFDERYFAYTEEYDIARRAKLAGWDVGLVWGAVVLNPIRAASSKITWYLLVRNQLLAVYDTNGLIAAGILSFRLVLARWVRRILGRAQPLEIETANARWRGVCDFWRGRFGPPPSDLR